MAYDREQRIGIYKAIEALRSKGVRVSAKSVKNYFGNALTYDYRGRLMAKDADPNLRVMRLLTTEGVREVYVRGSKNASVVGSHESGVRAALVGDEAALSRWRAAYGDRAYTGTDGRTYVAETDPDAITELDERGALEFEDIYPDVT